MDIRFLKGVGEKRAQLLSKLGICTVQDLINYYPKNYIDFSKPYPLAYAPYNIKCVVKATVYGKNSVRISGGREIHKANCADETGELVVNFFNNPYTIKKLEISKEYFFYGKLTSNFSVKEMINPTVLSTFDAENTPFIPIYAQTEGINSAYISKLLQAYFKTAQCISENIPQQIINKYKLMGKNEAVTLIHFPKNLQDIQNARRRLIFEELLCVQLGLLLLRKNASALTCAQISSINLQPFFNTLPYKPTNAQSNAIKEILADMSNIYAMNRLLQGDVGSGKTLCCAAAMFACAKNNYQSVLMAPTEILAIQHAASLQKMFKPLNIDVVLLTGSVKGKARKLALEQIQNGTAQIIVGTHAVIGDEVTFKNLALAVTDEQHRFGVRQRSKLAAKANHPHLLVMSATPIPRTLSLLMFKDLDISVLDELPPGRTPIKTYAINSLKRTDMYGFLLQLLKQGRQGYIICPLIEDGAQDMAAAVTYFEETAKPLLKGYNVGLMHGKLKSAQKSEVMQNFVNGNFDVLVSTTVIEVGVDVPNAAIIVIENAERYGLSALHQLRGRVGRGKHESFCILISDNTQDSVKERLTFMCKNQDGFEIAKYDLETRGPGDFFGNRQHGLPTLRIADLATDTRILYEAQKVAAMLIEEDENLQSKQNENLLAQVNNLFNKDIALN